MRLHAALISVRAGSLEQVLVLPGLVGASEYQPRMVQAVCVCKLHQTRENYEHLNSQLILAILSSPSNLSRSLKISKI